IGVGIASYKRVMKLSALIKAQGRKSDHCCLIRVEARTIPRENMSSLVPYITKLHAGALRDFALNGQVPGVESRQSHAFRTDLGVSLVIKWNRAIRRLYLGQGGEGVGRRGNTKGEQGIFAAVIERLVHQDGQILSHSVTEN